MPAIAAAVIVGGASIYSANKASKTGKSANALQARQLALEEERLAMARDDWEHYKTVFRPLEADIVAEANTGYDPAVWAGRGAVDANAAFDNVSAQQRRGLERFGVNPNSGRYLSAEGQLTRDRALGVAGAMNQGRQWATDTGFQRRLNALSLGKGIPTQTQATLGGVAGSFGNAAAGQRNQAQGYMNDASAAASTVGRIAQSIPWGDIPAVSTWGNASGYSGVNTGSAQDSMLAEQTAGFDGAGAYSFADGGLIGRDGGLRRFADGGPVDADGYVQGPGTPTSDSIPALIDGQQPAALSTDEYVIPADVVRAKGTEFFDKLVAQYHTPVNRGLRRVN